MSLANKSLSQEEVLDIFKESGALLEGHFLLTSGKHSNQYMQCAKVLQYPHHAARLGEALALAFQDQDIDLVIGPATGGIIVAHEVGRALGTKAIFAEREQGEMTLRRGFQLEPGQKVLVVEDVITTGGSVKEVIDLVKAHGAEPIGVGVLVNRSGGRAEFPMPFASLLQIEVEAYEAETCPLCQEGSQPIKPGSRNISK